MGRKKKNKEEKEIIADLPVVKEEEPKQKQINGSLQTSKSYSFVTLKGDVYVNVDGVLEAIKSGLIFEYACLAKNKNTTLMGGPRYYMHSYLFNALNNMKRFGGPAYFDGQDQPGWYNTRWYNNQFPLKEGEKYNRIWDRLFYDEFIFLYGEGFLYADEIKLSDEDIEWGNQQYLFAIDKENTSIPEYLKPLYEAKDKKELRKVWAKLCQAYHPDVVKSQQVDELGISDVHGSDADKIRKINEIYELLSKNFK